MFLLEVERIEQLLDEAGKNFEIASEHLTETKEQHEKMKSEYAAMEEAMTQMDEKISNLKDSIAGTDVTKGKLEGQINVLKEQIHTAQLTKEHLGERIASIEVQQEERRQQGSTYDAQRQEYETQLAAIEKTREQAQEKLQSIQAEITRCKEGIEEGKNEIIELLNRKASVKAGQQRYDTMLEQIQIRKSQLNQRLLQRKIEESGLVEALQKSEQELADIEAGDRKRQRKRSEDAGAEGRVAAKDTGEC